MPHATRNTLTAIVLMVVAMAAFAVMNAMIGHLARELPPPLMVFLRNAIGLALLAPWIAAHGMSGLKTARAWRHVWRAAIGLVAMETWFYTLAHLPLNESTALSFTSPLFATLFAALMLKETIGPARLVALLAGFGGAMIVIRPGTEMAEHPAVFVALFSSAMMALAGILVKTLTTTEPAWRIVTYMTLLMSLFSAPLALPFLRPLNGEQWLLMFGIAVFSTCAQMAMAHAFQRAPVNVLAPFDFTRLVFTALLAYIVFGETPEAFTFLGAAVILGSSVFIAWREARKKISHEPAF